MNFVIAIVASLRAIAAWLWTRPAVLCATIGTFVGAMIMLRSKANQINSLKDATQVQRAKARIARAEAKAEALEVDADRHADTIKRLKTEIAFSKKRAIEIAEKVNLEGMSNDEIAKRFSNAGL